MRTEYEPLTTLRESETDMPVEYYELSITLREEEKLVESVMTNANDDPTALVEEFQFDEPVDERREQHFHMCIIC
ncbi:Protein of unknown function [Pyronema omphalodes CBS 100304]|uniref:Uncharacterized protein n=1 Tax=Pyronema omphalodes (strain CBS 100304) TaxID=1076935 RepID=U4L8I5_PYROM|nr:Protein of unknown function [Pyronema omphalodes CBS 100304]